MNKYIKEKFDFDHWHDDKYKEWSNMFFDVEHKDMVYIGDVENILHDMLSEIGTEIDRYIND